MKAWVRAIGIALLIISNLALIYIWAINGYENTFFYVVLLLLTIPTSWVHFLKKDKSQ